jgi:cytosine/adenosine deaminase-related metal-dependent hydrolase
MEVPPMQRTLIRGGTLLTLGTPCRVLERQAVLIEGDRIASIAPVSDVDGAALAARSRELARKLWERF